MATVAPGGFGEAGFVEGKNLAFDFRWANNRRELNEIAADMARRTVDVIVSLGGIAAAYWIRRPQWVAWSLSPLAGIIALLALAIAFTAFNRAFNLGALLLLSLFFVIVASGNTLFGDGTTPSGLTLVKAKAYIAQR